jgi:hypothetical protein
MQIFFSTVAYLFVYDLDSLPKNISCYFYPISLERARAIASLLMVKDSPAYRIEQNPEAINILSERLSRLLLKTAKSYKKRSSITVMRRLFMKYIQRQLAIFYIMLKTRCNII